MPPSENKLLLVERQSSLDRTCEDLAHFDELAVDTEFVRTDTYYPQLGLIQIQAGQRTICIDPLSGIDLEGLWNLLFDPERRMILHAAKQDLEVLFLAADRLPQAVIDTQIEAGLLGHPAQFGYAALAEALMRANINKSQTRTDWCRRPLTEAQLRYAAGDVAYLSGLHHLMRQRLEKLGRYEWAVEDCTPLADREQYAPDPANAWQRLNRIAYLPPAEQNRARRLAEWREREAMRLNRPRRWILSDRAMIEIARHNPAAADELARCAELPPAVLRKCGRALLAEVDHANAEFSADDTQLRQKSRPPDADPALVKELLRIVRQHAERLDIAAEVLASRREIVAIIRGDRNVRPLRGWRLEEFGRELQEREQS